MFFSFQMEDEKLVVDKIIENIEKNNSKHGVPQSSEEILMNWKKCMNSCK